MKYYLAYGMNTNKSGMAGRCPAARSLGKVVLEDHRLAFKNHADAVRSPGSKMECALWLITSACEASLDILEGYPFYYNKKMVDVDFRGTTVRAMIYFMTDNQLYSAPGTGYVNMMRTGYAEHEMNENGIDRALTESMVLA